MNYTDAIDAIVAAAQAARPQGIEAAEAAAQHKATELGVILPSEDFCLHGEYFDCATCEAIFA